MFALVPTGYNIELQFVMLQMFSSVYIYVHRSGQDCFHTIVCIYILVRVVVVSFKCGTL